jgi:hypothetical protein
VAGRERRQHQAYRREGRDRGQRPAGALLVEDDETVPERAGQQADPEDPVAGDHHGREHGVASQRGGVALAADHEHDDEAHLDDRHGDREDQRAVGLTDPVRDDLRVLHRREHGGSEQDRDKDERNGSQPLPAPGRQQGEDGEDRGERGPP